jgi:hypothetical protein
MTTVVADATLPAKLAALSGEAEIVDVKGRRLGVYIPEPVMPDVICPWDPTLTAAEAERIADEPEGYSLDEIIRELEGK